VSDAAGRSTAQQDRGSGRQGRAPEPRYLAIGQVVGTHGVQGELKVAILTDDPTRFGRLKRVYIGLDNAEPERRRLEHVRLHQRRALLKISECDDRTAAGTLLGYFVYIPFEDALPLAEGEYYEHQIVGLEVWTVAGEHLGEVAEIVYTGANDVYLIRTPDGGELLIPAIADVIQTVDLDAGRLTVQLLEGLR
jgi:16S rRNA processing protein RimM